MIKRSFFGIATPKLRYDAIEDTQSEPVSVAPKDRITLFVDVPFEKGGVAALKTGDAVKRGQRLQLYEGDAGHYAVSPVAGKIARISPFIGMMQKQMTAIEINVDKDGTEADASFKEAAGSPSLASAARFLEAIPGKPDFSPFADADQQIKTIAVVGTDRDLLTVTNQYVIKTGIVSVKTGIDILRKITGIQNVVLIVPQHLVQVAGAAGAGVKSVDIEYPAGHPQMIMLHLLTEQAQDSGVAFFTAEAVSAIGAAFNTGQVPLEKLITVVKKNGSKQLVQAPIGTHVADILDAVSESVDSGDRVIFGGPMTGNAVYSLDLPVEPDTDTVVIQDKTRVMAGVDMPCTNCGECVRICPVNIPVNELVRYLDAGEYEQAAENAALYACIECGLCAYVCESRIPIFQFIRLAKHSLERMKAAEENNA